jgi:hypothetical protein
MLIKVKENIGKDSFSEFGCPGTVYSVLQDNIGYYIKPKGETNWYLDDFCVENPTSCTIDSGKYPHYTVFEKVEEFYIVNGFVQRLAFAPCSFEESLNFYKDLYPTKIYTTKEERYFLLRSNNPIFIDQCGDVHDFDIKGDYLNICGVSEEVSELYIFKREEDKWVKVWYKINS